MTDIDMKVTEAMHRIEELYYETDGKCYVSFSGGKDSTVLLALIKMCEDIYTIPANGIPAVFGNTGIELSVTTDFVRWCKENWYTNIEMVRPEHSFDWVLKNKGKPMLSKLRSQYLNRWQRGMRTETIMLNFIGGVTKQGGKSFRIKIADKDVHMLHPGFPITGSEKCCTVMKKNPFKKYAREHGIKGYATGIRMAEGGVREMNAQVRQRIGGKVCTSIAGGLIQKAPLIDWTDEDLEQFIEKYDVPLSDAYTKYGFERTGCMACPYSRNVAHDLKYLHDHEPNRYKAAMHWLKDVYIAQNVELPFDESYEREREREHGMTCTNLCGKKC